MERDYFWKSEVVKNKQYFTDRLYSFGVNKKKQNESFFYLVVGLNISLLCLIVSMSPYN